MGLHDPNRLPENNPFTPPVAESLAVEPIDQLAKPSPSDTVTSATKNQSGHLAYFFS